MPLAENYRNSERYGYLIEECKAIVTEGVYAARTELILTYGRLGERVTSDPLYKKHSKGGFVQKLANDAEISQSELYRAVQFYQKFQITALGDEGWDEFKEEKNISWWKIKTRYLPQPKEKKKEKPKLEQVDGKWIVNIKPTEIHPKTLKKHYQYYKKNILPQKEQTYIQELMAYLTEKLDTGGIANWGKQARYIKQLKDAGYSVELIKRAIDKMLEDNFWRSKGFDFKNLADHIHKVVAKVKGRKKYEAADGTVFYDKQKAMEYIKKQ